MATDLFITEDDAARVLRVSGKPGSAGFPLLRGGVGGFGRARGGCATCNPGLDIRESVNDPTAPGLADAARFFGIGRTSLYALIGAGQVDARKSGRRTLVMADSLRAYIAGLPAAVIRMGRREADTKAAA